MRKTSFKPGEVAPKSGQYARILRTGRQTKKEVTVVKGKPIPPTPKKGQRYRLIDPTKH